MFFFSERFVKWALRVLLAGVFLFSGVSKLLAPERFLTEVGRLNFLGAGWDAPLAYGFIAFEFILGILLLFKFSNPVLLVTGGTVLLLSCYLAYKVIVRDPSDCGCFGNLVYRSNLSALVQDLVMIVAVVVLYE